MRREGTPTPVSVLSGRQLSGAVRAITTPMDPVFACSPSAALPSGSTPVAVAPSCGKCGTGCSSMYVWRSYRTPDTPFVCFTCAHRLSGAGELVERNHRLMRRAPRLETTHVFLERDLVPRLPLEH